MKLGNNDISKLIFGIIIFIVGLIKFAYDSNITVNKNNDDDNISAVYREQQKFHRKLSSRFFMILGALFIFFYLIGK